MDLHVSNYMTTPIGKKTQARVFVDGPMTARGIRHLIKLLEIDLEYLDDERPSEAAVPAVQVPIELSQPT